MKAEKEGKREDRKKNETQGLGVGGTGHRNAQKKRQVWLSLRNMRLWGFRIPPEVGSIMGPRDVYTLFN